MLGCGYLDTSQPGVGRYGRLMRQILPDHRADVEPLDIYPQAPRNTPADRPWVMINMIAGIDGGTAIDGVSGGLGGPGDKAVFGAIRASCDWILVASGTARAERYRIPQPSAEAREARVACGRTPAPRLAVVSGSLEFEADLPMLAERPGDLPRALVITGESAPKDRVENLRRVAEVIVLAEGRPTPAASLAELWRRDARVVLVEGGPSYNSQFAEAGLIDELCVSVAPKVTAGDSKRMMAGGAPLEPLDFTLDHLLEQDSMLFARYLRI